VSHDGGDRLPRLWRGVRRHLLVLLVLVGLGQAAAAGAGTRLMIRALHGSAASRPGPLFAVLIGAALLVGALRMVERIWAERLSQHYVHEVRLGLLRHILGSGETRSLGVAMTRTSNDLTSVKNWIALGIAPLVVGIPIIAGAMTVLAMINTAYAVAFAVPLLVLLLALLALRRPTLLRTRSLRRSRGRLAQQVADTVLAARTIQISGGARRELERMAATSSDLMSNAISRARFAGALRGAAAATTGLGTAAVIWAGIWAHRPAADTTAALTVVAFLVAPIQDLGRITEYRQTYVAARAMLGPAIGGPAPRRTVVPVVTTGQFGLQVGVLWRKDGHALPAFLASPGDRIIIAASAWPSFRQSTPTWSPNWPTCHRRSYVPWSATQLRGWPSCAARSPAISGTASRLRHPTRLRGSSIQSAWRCR
jgi:ABC-type multidrug transport system fused ATPase/permease subunit